MNTVLSSEHSRRVASTPGSRPNIGLLGATAFIISESMFFVGLFLAYFYLRSDRIGWPSDLSRPSIALPVFNTIILACSVIAIVWAERGIAQNRNQRLITGISFAAVLGLAFMALQSYEFTLLLNYGLAPGAGAYGSTFFALLGFHVLRVFAGVSFMVIVLIRALLGQFSRARRTVVQACALYWYFIACVWVVVFLVLYILR